VSPRRTLARTGAHRGSAIGSRYCEGMTQRSVTRRDFSVDGSRGGAGVRSTEHRQCSRGVSSRLRDIALCACRLLLINSNIGTNSPGRACLARAKSDSNFLIFGHDRRVSRARHVFGALTRPSARQSGRRARTSAALRIPAV